MLLSITDLLRRPSAALAALSGLALALAVGAARAAEPPTEFSAAERALFMSDQFANVRPPTTLKYAFHRSGSLEPGFDDRVALDLKALPGGACCEAAGEFLSGERKLPLPAIDGVKGNPATLFFLERDVREMERLTQGKSAYFRKRIRMAIFQGAEQRPVTLNYRGKAVPGQSFTINPYADDPNRSRFERFANKRYVFTLSNAVPGGVYSIRTEIADTTPGALQPLLAEDLLIDGADAGPVKPGPSKSGS